MTSNDFKDNLKYPVDYQKDLKDKIMYILDEYEKNNSFENREFLCYLTSAIYLVYKKLFPQLSIYIPFRTKSDISCLQNIQKEFSKQTENIDSLDIFPIIKDMSGIKIILNDINFSLPSTPEFEELINDPEIKKIIGSNSDLKKSIDIDSEIKKINEPDENTVDEDSLYSRHANFDFIDKLDNYIHSPIKSGKKYFELKRELLCRIIKITPKEFTEERTPDPSFIELLNDTQRKYKYFLENDNFPTDISDSKIADLTLLLNEFRSKVDDKLHFAILRKTLPIVFNHPLIKNALQTSYKHDKETQKPNTFQAIYDTLQTPFGPIEVQSQSNRANYAATKGSAYHSGMTGKSVNVKEFFELVDPNDPQDLSFYLDTLDSFSADKLISPYEIPTFKSDEEKEQFFKTPQGIAFLESEKYREMMKHIKFKDDIQIDNISVNANTYLLSTALSLSPYMNVCGSGHTSYTTAAIHHKKVVGEFAEVLRKKDSNTCLRELLLRKLEQLIETPPENCSESIKYSLQIVKEHDEIAKKLPKDISQKNILTYAEKLRTLEISNSNSEISK